MAIESLDPGDVIEDLSKAVTFLHDIECYEEVFYIKKSVDCILDLQYEIVALQQALYKMTVENIKNAVASKEI